MGDKHGNGNGPDGPDFPIGIRNGLLSPEHRKAMGIAVWEFVWCVEHVTEEYLNREGEIRGKVFGGAPIELGQIAEDLGMSESSVGDNLRRLEHAGYIARRRFPRGHQIEVRHSKKWPQRFLRPNTSPPSNQHQETVHPSEPPSPGDSVNRSIGDPVISPNGENANSPDHLFAETPIATNDIAMGSDKTMFHPAAEETHAREDTEVWREVVDRTASVIWQEVLQRAASRLPSSQAALVRTRPQTVDGNTLIVTLPAEPDAAAVVKRGWQILNDLVQQLMGSGATLRLENSQARGP